MGTWTLWQLHGHEVDEEVPGAFSSVQGLVLCKAGAVRVAGWLNTVRIRTTVTLINCKMVLQETPPPQSRCQLNGARTPATYTS